MSSKIPFLVRFSMWLRNFQPERERVYAIEVAATNKKLREKIASLEGQLAREIADKRKGKEEIGDKEKELEISKKLLKEDEKIRKEKRGKCVSLNAFFAKLYGIKIPSGVSDFNYRSKNFGKQLRVTDRNGEEVHIFGEMLISEKGHFIITNNKDEILVQTPLPQGLFYKPSSLRNQLNMKRIILGVDKNMNLIQDWDELEIPEPVWNEEKQEYELSERTEKARDLFIKSEDENRILKDKLEQAELIITSQKRELSDLKRARGIYVSDSRNAQSDLSTALASVMEMKKKDYEKTAKIVNLSESNTMKDERVKVLEKVNDEVMKKLENNIGKTSEEIARAKIEDAMEFVSQYPKKMQSPPGG